MKPDITELRQKNRVAETLFCRDPFSSQWIKWANQTILSLIERVERAEKSEAEKCDGNHRPESEAPMTPTEKAVEAMLDAVYANGLDDAEHDDMRRALTALISLYPGIASVIEGTGVCVPREPTMAMKRAGQIAGDNQLWKWRGLGDRGEGGGLDGMTSIIVEAFRAMLAAAESKPHD